MSLLNHNNIQMMSYDRWDESSGTESRLELHSTLAHGILRDMMSERATGENLVTQKVEQFSSK
jgi:hypothetical protein